MREQLPPLKERRVSVYHNALDTKPFDHLPLEKPLQHVREGKYLPAIRRIRSTEDKKARQELKKKTCPAMSFSGTFSKRANDQLKEHSGVIRADLDGLADKAAEKERLKQDPCVLAVFDSVSGELSDGLSVLCHVEPIPKDDSEHKVAFDALAERYGLDGFDPIVKGVSWLTYYSYDPGLYVNWKAEPITWDPNAARIPQRIKSREKKEVTIPDGQKYYTLRDYGTLLRHAGAPPEHIETALQAIRLRHGESEGEAEPVTKLAQWFGEQPFDPEQSLSTFRANVIKSLATEEEAEAYQAVDAETAIKNGLSQKLQRTPRLKRKSLQTSAPCLRWRFGAI